MNVEDDQTRDRWVDAGMWAVGLTAAVASWAGWVGLATLCGWADHWTLFGFIPVYLAWLLPLAVDVYALIGFRVWLRSGTASETTRQFARKSTFAAIGLGVGGNAGYHLMVSLSWTKAPWPVVVLVSALPPIMLGAVAHLSALRNRDTSKPKPVSVEELQVAADETTPDTGGETTPPAPVETPGPVVGPKRETPRPAPVKTRSETPKTTPAKTAPARTQTAVKPTDEDHLKMIRETYPQWSSKTVSLGQIKTAIGISGQATAIRLRDALYPNGRPDQTAAETASSAGPETGLETAPVPVPMTPFPEPNPAVVAGTNGNTPNLTKEPS